MKLRAALFLLAALSLAGCASKPVNDPGGKWAKQAETLDNSLFY
jgi:type IV pilus biogenesis protein CpaD/CtpE